MFTFPFTLSPKFWEFNPWEPSVATAVRDVCKYGDIVFDIGAHSAGITVEMSRAVGPKGVVCSFEANLENVKRSHENIISAHATNVQLYHNAVYNRSGEIVKLYERIGGNDSLFCIDSDEPFQSVPTISIDDFVAETSLCPSVIKIDIEGGEYEALLGASSVISMLSTIFILEQDCSDVRCFDLLLQRGYRAVDLGTYTEIRDRDSYRLYQGALNIIYIPAHMTSPYFRTERVFIADLDKSMFDISVSGAELKSPIELRAGRYLCVADFSASGQENDAIAGVENESGFACLYCASTGRLALGARNWCFNLRSNTKINPYLRILNGLDDTFDWRGVKVFEYPAFAERISRLR